MKYTKTVSVTAVPYEGGYNITTKEGLSFWVSKEDFEKEYTPEITDDYISSNIISSSINRIDDRSMSLTITLQCGRTITETHSWDDPASYDIQIGEGICLGKIIAAIKANPELMNHAG